MKKRIIAIMLAVVLVAGGLGSFAYAVDSVNEVEAHFNSEWIYSPPGDIFVGKDPATGELIEVIGFQHWHANMNNSPDATGAPVTGLALTLASELEFGDLNPDPATPGPPLYAWSFDNIPEESGAEAWVGLRISPDPFPVTFEPGFDASRSVNQTVFSEPGTQTLTIKLTPQDVTEGLSIDIHAYEDDLVNPVITSPSSGDGFWLSPDGHRLIIQPTGLVLGTEWPIVVTIQVTPKVPEVDFMPFVGIGRHQFGASGSTSGNSVSHPVGNPVDGIGTWTWSAEGSYEWYWKEAVQPSVHWHFWSRDLSNKVQAGFNTNWHYNVPGDTFENQPVEGEKSWGTGLDNNWPDDSGEPVNGVTLTLQSDQEFDYMNPDPDSTNPPTWLFGTVAQGSRVGAGVGSVSGTFTPGFDASRSANTVFTAPETQVLTINVTPRVEEEDGFIIDVDAGEHLLVNALISSVSTTEGYDTQVSWDEGYVHIVVMDLGLDNTFTATVGIQVTPNVPKVEYLPSVRVSRILKWPLDTISGNSVELTAEIGTWTWSADGNYEWLVHSTGGSTAYNLTWQHLYREIVEPVPPIVHEPMTGQKLVGHGAYGVFPSEEDGTYLEFAGSFTVTNPDCVSEITIDRISIFDFDGIVIYEGDLFEVDWEDGEPVVTYWTEPLKPHEQRWIEVDSTMVYLRDQGYWEGDHIFFTVEIFWRWTDKEGLPLTGWAGGRIAKRAADGHIIEFQSGSATQMVNMEQVLTPEKEKEVTTLRLQTWQQPDDPLMQPLENFVQAVAESSGGSVQVELYPAVPLGEIAEAVRQGEVEMGLMYSTVLQYSPNVMDASQLPFLYNDDDGLMTAVQAGIGDLMSEALQEPNITILDWTTMAFSHLFSRETMLDEPSDVAGLKIRVPGLVIRAEAISEWGGEPVTMSLAEVYTALERGVIDGAALPPSLYVSLKLYELQQLAPYFFCEGYAFGGLAGLGINSDVWDSLDAKTQDDIAKAAGDYVVEMLETVKLVDEAALETIQGYGVEVKTLTPGERLVWREASQPVWEWWLEELGDARPVGEEIIAIALEHNPLLAPPKTLRLQTWFQPEDPLMQPLENFAQAVNNKSDLVRIELYPAVPLGEITEAVRRGDVEMGLLYCTVLQYSPNVMDASQLPFLYNDDDGLMAAVQAGIGDLLSGALQEPNITVLDWTTMGLSHLFSRETMLDEPSDVAGLKIRVPGLVIRAEAISEWGGEPVTMPASEMYMALRDELIDGASFPLHAYDAFKLYEVAPYFCVDYAFGGLAGLCINSDVWDSLDDNTRKIITKAAGNYVVEMLETVKDVDTEALQQIQQHPGFPVEVYTLTPEERLVWREASEDVWYDWADDVGPVGLEIIAIALEHNPLP